MMACSCGGLTVKDQARRCGISLRWERCGSCGRCGRYRLKAASRMIAHGEVARRAFGDNAVMERVARRTRCRTNSNGGKSVIGFNEEREAKSSAQERLNTTCAR